MIDLRPALNEAMGNIQNWRNKYSPKEYPHKIVLNMMYRAYSTRIVYNSFAQDEMVDFDDFDEAVLYVLRFYGETALTEVNPYLIGWMHDRPNEQVGSLTTAKYEALASKAENSESSLEELEFSYIFEMINDMCVLYFIAFRLSGLSEVDAIAKMTNIIIEPLDRMDYAITKQAFLQLLVAKFMGENYRPLPK